jgi:short chain dehydrogenase
MAHHAQMSSGTLPSVQELFSLTGKTAIVTGGTGGLGLAMSIALGEAGADIVSIQIANDPRSNLLVDAMKELGRKLQVFETDVSDSPKLRQCFAKIWEAGVVPDILLNCAGINRRSQVENFTDEDIDAVSKPEKNNSSSVEHSLRHSREAQLKGNAGHKISGSFPLADPSFGIGLRNQSQSILCRRAGIWQEAPGIEAPWQDRQHCVNHLIHRKYKHRSVRMHERWRAADDKGFQQ